MKTQTLTPKLIRQRKALLVFPVIIVTFVTILFKSLGGGKGEDVTGDTSQKGLNTQLPDASLKTKNPLNKMSYYDKAAADSNRIRQLMRSDPYYHFHDPVDSDFKSPSGSGSSQLTEHDPKADNPAMKQSPRDVPGDQLVYQKLARLQNLVNSTPDPPVRETKPLSKVNLQIPAIPAASQQDPELQQMGGLLDKILAIQHPGKPDHHMEKATRDTTTFRAIPAVIDGKQKITQGTVVRLRLLDSVRIGGISIPKGQLIFGSGTLYNQRYTMTVKAIRLGYTILPVDLTVFDMADGIEGISVPEAITAEAAKEGATSGVEGLELMSFDPSISTQLAGAGINAAKGLFSRKVRMVKGKLKNGHLLLLRDNEKPHPTEK